MKIQKQKSIIYVVLVVALFFMQIIEAQVYNDNSSFNLVSANNNGQVRLRNAPGGSGNIANIKNLCNSAGIPAVVRDSRLTTGEFASNICQMAAVTQTLQLLADRRATYTGSGTVVTNSNLEQHRSAIAASGGTFIFRGTVNVTSKEKLIQVGANTTIWIDGTVRYTGPVIPGTIPDQYSVSDVINGIFEVRGARNNPKNGAKFYGTKRGKLVGNNRLAGVYTWWSSNLRIEGVSTDNCRNVMFLHNVSGTSVVKGNFIYNSTRRAIHLKATNGVLVENNFVYDADVDGIDVDAYAKNTKVNRNLLIKSGSRWQVWTEIVAVDNTIDGNVGVHVNETDGGFQENGSETGQSPTARNKWINNHVFYANSTTVYKQGFSFHPNRVIDRASTTFKNNYVWQTKSNAYKNNPKNNEDDVSYYMYNGAPPSNAISIPGRVEAEDYTNMNGIQTQNTSDAGGGKNVGWIGTNDWMDYKVNVQSAGSYTVKFRVASKSNNIKLDLKKGNTVLTSVNTSKTNGWQTWKTVSKTVNLSAGEQTLRVLATGPSWNINYIDFEAAGSGGGTPPAGSVITVQAESFNSTGGTFNDGHVSGGGANKGATSINWVNKGDWVQYNNINIPEDGAYEIVYYISSPITGSTIDFSVGNTKLNTTTVPNNGQWDSYTALTASSTVNFTAGNHNIKLTAGAQNWTWNLDKFTLQRVGAMKGAFEESTELPGISIYPNPATDVLNIQLAGEATGKVSYSIYSSAGTKLRTGMLETGFQQLSLSDFSSGMYVLQIRSGSAIITEQFIKE